MVELTCHSLNYTAFYFVLQIVAILLDKTDKQTMYDALLLAISLDHDEIALIILKHPSYEQVKFRF